MNNVKIIKLKKYIRPHRGLIKDADFVPSVNAGNVGGKPTAYEKDSILKEVEISLDKLEKMIKSLEEE